MTIQCTKEEKMKSICQRYGTKLQRNINTLIFLYGGNQLNFELSFEEQASSLDRASKVMKVLVYTKENEEFTCPKCGEKVKLKTEKLDELISSNNNIKDKIEGIVFNLDMIIKSSSLINTMNNQLKNINFVLNTINEDIQKINEKIKNLLNDNININEYINNKNIIRGCLNINSNEINNNITLFYTDINNNIDVNINKEKIEIIKDNDEWKYNFKKDGNYNFEIIFNDNIINMNGFFEKCSNLILLDFNNFDTSNVTDMLFMFN